MFASSHGSSARVVPVREGSRRKVFPNSMVAHVWAQQRQQEGKSANGNFSFEGTTIYSYSTPIARFVKDKDGSDVVLYSQRSYSLSTSGHQSDVRSAIGNLTSYGVEEVGRGGRNNGAHDEASIIRDGLAHMVTSILTTLASAGTASITSYRGTWVVPCDPASHIRYPAYWSNEAETDHTDVTARPRFLRNVPNAITEAETFANAFGLMISRPDLESALAKAVETFRARCAAFHDPEAVAKREKAKAARERANERKAEAEAAAQVVAAEAARVANLAAFTAWRADPTTARRPSAWLFAEGSAERIAIETAQDVEREEANQASLERNRANFAAWQAGAINAARPTRYAFPRGSAEHTAILADEEREQRERQAESEARKAELMARYTAWVADPDAMFARRPSLESFYKGSEEHSAIRADMTKDSAREKAAWMAGANNSFRGTDNNGCAFIRAKDDELQTSEGASVPLRHAIRVFQFVKLCRDTKTPWHRNGRTIRVGHFEVDSVDAKGNFKAGCHSFAWSEVERLARLLGVFEKPASADVVETREGVL